MSVEICSTINWCVKRCAFVYIRPCERPVRWYSIRVEFILITRTSLRRDSPTGRSLCKCIQIPRRSLVIVHNNNDKPPDALLCCQNRRTFAALTLDADAVRRNPRNPEPHIHAHTHIRSTCLSVMINICSAAKCCEKGRPRRFDSPVPFAVRQRLKGFNGPIKCSRLRPHPHSHTHTRTHRSGSRKTSPGAPGPDRNIIRSGTHAHHTRRTQNG